MSKMFFKGRIDPRVNNQRFGYNTKRTTKAGTANAPLTLRVSTVERQNEIEQVLHENNLVADITVDSEQDEQLTELTTLLNKPRPQTFADKPQRNDPCSCGSGKKFKKCCAN